MPHEPRLQAGAQAGVAVRALAGLIGFHHEADPVQELFVVGLVGIVESIFLFAHDAFLEGEMRRCLGMERAEQIGDRGFATVVAVANLFHYPDKLAVLVIQAVDSGIEFVFQAAQRHGRCPVWLRFAFEVHLHINHTISMVESQETGIPGGASV